MICEIPYSCRKTLHAHVARTVQCAFHARASRFHNHVLVRVSPLAHACRADSRSSLIIRGRLILPKVYQNMLTGSFCVDIYPFRKKAFVTLIH